MQVILVLRFEVSMVVKIHISLWDGIPCSVVVEYHLFRSWYLHLQEAARSFKMLLSYCNTIQHHNPVFNF